MELSVGQKVAYPGQGVCLVEKIEKKTIGNNPMSFYLLRILNDNSTIFVPTCNAESVGIRPIISTSQCRRLMRNLSADFEDVSHDWKARSREFTEKLQSGDVFEAADVLKKLTYLSHGKKLSFREQALLEKAKFLIVSEIVYADSDEESTVEPRVCKLVESACEKHMCSHAGELSAAVAVIH